MFHFANATATLKTKHLVETVKLQLFHHQKIRQMNDKKKTNKQTNNQNRNTHTRFGVHGECFEYNY